MSNDIQAITLTPDFLRKIDGLLEDYNSGNEYAIDRIVGVYKDKYGVQVSNADMLGALQAEGLIE